MLRFRYCIFQLFFSNFMKENMLFPSQVDTNITQNLAIQKFLGSAEIYVAISKNLRSNISSNGEFNFGSGFL